MNARANVDQQSLQGQNIILEDNFMENHEDVMYEIYILHEEMLSLRCK